MTIIQMTIAVNPSAMLPANGKTENMNNICMNYLNIFFKIVLYTQNAGQNMLFICKNYTVYKK